MRQPLWRMIDEWQAWQPLHVELRLLLGCSVKAKLTATKPRTPVLQIHGDQKKQLGAQIKTLLPRANVASIPDSGRVSNPEQPPLFTITFSAFLS